MHTGPPRNVLLLIEYRQIVNQTFQDIPSVHQAILCQTTAKYIYIYIYVYILKRCPM